MDNKMEKSVLVQIQESVERCWKNSHRSLSVYDLSEILHNTNHYRIFGTFDQVIADEERNKYKEAILKDECPAVSFVDNDYGKKIRKGELVPTSVFSDFKKELLELSNEISDIISCLYVENKTPVELSAIGQRITDKGKNSKTKYGLTIKNCLETVLNDMFDIVYQHNKFDIAHQNGMVCYVIPKPTQKAFPDGGHRAVEYYENSLTGKEGVNIDNIRKLISKLSLEELRRISIPVDIVVKHLSSLR